MLIISLAYPLKSGEENTRKDAWYQLRTPVCSGKFYNVCNRNIRILLACRRHMTIDVGKNFRGHLIFHHHFTEKENDV